MLTFLFFEEPVLPTTFPTEVKCQVWWSLIWIAVHFLRLKLEGNNGDSLFRSPPL